MFFLPGGVGLVLGSIVFMFMHIASKRSGRYYLAPLATFLVAILLTLYGLIVIGGFEGMGYGVLAFGFLLIAIIGTLLLPIKMRKGVGRKDFSKKDKISLFLLPFLLIAIIFSLNYFEKDYWIIEEGTQPYNESIRDGYTTSTISEGRKMIHIELGEDYEGKMIQVKKVTHRGATTIVIDIQDHGIQQQVPFIKIGLDQIKDDLIVKTTDDVIIEE